MKAACSTTSPRRLDPPNSFDFESPDQVSLTWGQECLGLYQASNIGNTEIYGKPLVVKQGYRTEGLRWMPQGVRVGSCWLGLVDCREIGPGSQLRQDRERNVLDSVQ